MLQPDLDLKLLPRQLRGLVRQTDAALVWFCAALLALDLLFIAVFAYRTYTALYTDQTSRLGIQWHIGRDWSYAEMVGYAKLALIVSTLILIFARRPSPIYLSLIALFTVALLDVSLRLHERLGKNLTEALALRTRVLGELMIWTVLGAFLFTVTHAGFIRSPREDRRYGLLLLGAFAVLGFFSVVADLAHVLVFRLFRHPVVDSVLTAIEDGGEQITLTLTCGLVLLLRRELAPKQP